MPIGVGLGFQRIAESTYTIGVDGIAPSAYIDIMEGGNGSRPITETQMPIRTTINEAGRIVTFTSATDYLAVHLDRIHPANLAYAALHGIKQRVGDAGALGFDKDLGRYPTDDEKFVAMRKVAEHLMSGSAEWDIRVAGEPKGGMLFEALKRAYPDKSTDDLKAFIKARSKAEQAALLSAPAIKVHVDAIRAEAGKGVDTDTLLAGL
jgi:hypothetical protein